MELQCRRYAASYLNLPNTSRSKSEKMLLLALAEWWLDLAERANQGSRLQSPAPDHEAPMGLGRARVKRAEITRRATK
jgi:hypothetical protein